MRKKSLSHIRKLLDADFRQACTLRDGGRCKKCRSNEVIQVHHIFTKKAYPAGRWITQNGVTLCRSCHFTAHKYIEDFRRWVIKWMGEKNYDNLFFRVKELQRFRACDYEEIKNKIAEG